MIPSASNVCEVMRTSVLNLNPDLTERVLLGAEDLVRIAETLKVVPIAREDSVLVDMGCYSPMISLYKKMLGYRTITACSRYNWDLLSRAHEKAAKREDIDLHVQICDLEEERLDLADESADVVLLLEVLEHFSKDPMKVICEINRVLKTNGVLVLSTPNATSWRTVLAAVRGLNPHPESYNGIDSNRHNRLYSPDEIERLIHNGGLELDVLRTIEYSPRSSRYIRFVDLLNLARGRNLIRLRGEIILAKGVKKSQMRDRYPSWLYVDREKWKEWYEGKYELS